MVRCIQSCNKLHYSQLLRLRSDAAAGLLLASFCAAHSQTRSAMSSSAGSIAGGKVSSRHCAAGGSCEGCALSGLLACSLERLGRCLGRCLSRGVRSRGWWLWLNWLWLGLGRSGGGSLLRVFFFEQQHYWKFIVAFCEARSRKPCRPSRGQALTDLPSSWQRNAVRVGAAPELELQCDFG